MRLLFAHELQDFRADAAQIAPVHVGEYVEHRPDVVMVDDDRHVGAVHRSQVGEQLRAARGRAWIAVCLRVAARRCANRCGSGGRCAGERARRGGVDGAARGRDRCAEQGIERIDAVLRRLHADVVVHAVGPVQPEVRRHRAAATERDQHAAGYVALRESHFGGLGAVDIETDHGLIGDLMHVHIGRAGYRGDAAGHLLRDGVVGLGVAADDLQVDGRGQAEVEDLARDVRGLEEEGHVREALAQALAEEDFVVARGAVVLLVERNEDLAIGGGDGRDIALGDGGPTVRDADVIDQHLDFIGRDYGADFVLEGSEADFGLFDARPGGPARVQAHLAGIDGREKVLADQQRETERSGEERAEGDERAAAMAQGPIEQPDVTVAKLFESMVEELMAAVKDAPAVAVAGDLRCEQVRHHGRDQRAGKQIGREHREHHRHGERREQVARGSGEQQHRHENDADGERGDEGRDRDLRGAIQHRREDWLAHGEIAVGVFDFDGGVVYEYSDRERETAEGHHVDGFAEQAEHAERGEDRKRDGDADDQSAAPASQEEEDHQAGEAGGDQGLAQHALNRGTHENGLIRQRRDLQLRRNVGEDARQFGFDGIDDAERGRLAVARDGDEHAARAVGAHDIVLDVEAVAHLGDILDIYIRAVDRLDRQIVERVPIGRAAADLNLVFGAAELGGAGGENQVLQVEGVGDIDGGEPLGIELIEVEIHHDGPLLSAERVGDGGALHGAERRADEVVADVEDLLLAEGLAGESELEDRHARSVVLQDVRREHAGRHLAQRRVHRGGGLRHRHIDLDVRMEVNFDDGVARIGLRFDVLDVVDVGGEAALEAGHHALFHLFGREAGVHPEHADHGDIDVGEDIHRHGAYGCPAEDGDEDGHHDEGVRAAEGEADNPHKRVV